MEQNAVEMFLSLDPEIDPLEPISLIFGIYRFYKNGKQMYAVDYHGNLSLGYIIDESLLYDPFKTSPYTKSTFYKHIEKEEALTLFPELVYMINLLD